MSKDARLYACIAALPPWIILCYLYARNAAYINYGHVLLVAAVFSGLSFGFYLAIARLGKSPGRAALVTVAVWVVVFAMRPLYMALTNRAFFLTRSQCIMLTALVPLLAVAVVFVLARHVTMSAVYKLIVVFETALFLLNVVPGTFVFLTSKEERLAYTLKNEDFHVDAETPSPNIYWILSDAMLGFEGMERLFGDRQDEFAAALEGRGFVINRNAEFESFHGTIRAVPALMCPNYYDTVFLPILTQVDLHDYENKKKALGRINPVNARLNNEFVAAFNAKGYSTNTIAGFDVYFFPTTKYFFTTHIVLKDDGDGINAQTFQSDVESYQLQTLMYQACMPYALFIQLLEKSVLLPPGTDETQKIFGSHYTGGIWDVDALEEVFTEPEPRFTIMHEFIAHYPFVFTEDGSKALRAKGEEQSPANYPPQHRYAAKVVLGYIDLILAHDPDAVIVVQADHGLHNEENREALLAAGGTEEDVRVMQNSVMSAVRIPEKWGGLNAPLDPLNISRELVNRYVGDNYTLLEIHP